MTRTFSARSMSEALAKVKQELGPNAMILSTRTLKQGGFAGIGARTITEITAEPAPRGERHRVREPKPTALRQTQPAMPTTRAGQAAQAYAAPTNYLQSNATLADTQTATPRLAQQPSQHDTDSLHDSSMLYQIDQAARTMVDQPRPHARAQAAIPRRVESAARHDAFQSSPVNTANSADVRDELNEMRAMLGRMMRTQRATPQPNMPQPLFKLYNQMLEAEVPDDIADTIIGHVRDALSPEHLNQIVRVQDAVLDQLSALIPVSQGTDRLGRAADGRPHTIAFVGPTGVGKTTTLAKLAASLKLREGKKVGLITCDTYRIAAVDQLRTYANIIGLPIRVALTPAEIEQACEAMDDCDVILIDTAGRSPRDESRIAELRSFLDHARPHEVHLVLSSAASRSVLDEAVQRFGELTPDHVIFTKLDEAVKIGTLLSTISAINATLSYITTGQEVPEHIEPCEPRRLAELVLGKERVA